MYSNVYMERKAFLDQEPPPGYVAGIGRGATGFTTSADTGPVRFESEFGNEAENEDDVGIFAGRQTQDDDEADRIYEEIDARMQRRHKKRDEEITDVVEVHTGNGTIKEKFSQFKTQLATVSLDEWANIPEVGDLTRKNKRQRLLDQQQQRTYAAPDMLIAGAGNAIRSETGLVVDQAAPNQALLDEIEEAAEQEGDFTRSRLILASLRKTEPNKADLWISSARLEVQARNFSTAKSLIMEGCTKVPHSESVWLESVRIHQKSSEGTKVCKAIINDALRLNTESEKLWFQAMELENPADLFSRKKIIMKALEFLPTSVTLWKALIDLESESSDAIRLLEKATELCPNEWDFWLTLVNLSPYADAKSVLNKARKQLPTNHEVWIAALKLEEREHSEITHQKLSTMLSKGFKELAKHGSNTLANQWLEDAAASEKEDFIKTCNAIVENALDLEDGAAKLPFLLSCAEKYGSTQTSNFIYQYITKNYPHDVGGWVRLFASLKKGEVLLPELYDFYAQAIALNPMCELFYLMYAKDKWTIGEDVPGARLILEDASKVLTTSEKIWLARVKLEVRNHSYDMGYQVSKQALEEILGNSVRAWYKHIHLLRFCVYKKLDFVSLDSVLTASNEALELFPDNYKLYLQNLQILVEEGKLKEAREALSIGSRKCPKSAEIWCALAQVDISLGALARARSLLDTATLQDANQDLLWDTKITLEVQEKDMITARQLVSKALKLFPSSSLIWMHNLSMILKMSHRKNAFLDALKQTNNSTEILLGIGVFFWIDGKFAKAKSWFDRSLAADKRNGDAWGWAYSFVSKNGSPEDLQKLLVEAELVFDEINKGRTWNRVIKSYKNYDKTPSECVKLVSEELLATAMTM